MKKLDNLLSNQKKYFSSQLIHLSVQDRITKLNKYVLGSAVIRIILLKIV